MNKKSKSQKQIKKRPLAKRRRSPLVQWDIVSRGKGREAIFPFAMAASRNMRVHTLPRPLGPHPGAALTIKQMPSTFGVQSGLSNVGGSSVPANLIQNSAVFLNTTIAFQLSDIPNVSTLAALFDQYRIDKVLLRVKSRNNAVFVANTASPNGAVPTAYAVRDIDDASALSTMSDYLQYDTCLTFSGEEDFVIELTPSVTKAVFSSGAFSGYTVDQPCWLDIANTSIPHYGVKIGVGGLTASTTSSWAWDVTAEYIVSFMSTR